MRQQPLVPDSNCLGLLVVKRAGCSELGVVGAEERDGEVECCTALKHEANATQHAIHFPVRAEPVDIDQRQALRLLYQFFVCHVIPRTEAGQDQSTVEFRAQGCHTRGANKNFQRSFFVTGLPVFPMRQRDDGNRGENGHEQADCVGVIPHHAALHGVA